MVKTERLPEKKMNIRLLQSTPSMLQIFA